MSALRPLGADTVHLVIDMQRLFAEETEWHVPGMVRLIGPISALCRAHPDATVFTRFITPHTAAEAPGEWRRYYERWRSVTLDQMDPALLDLIPALRTCVPPGEVIDKHSYGGFSAPAFQASLQRRRASALVLTGIETEVCVLSTALQAIDRGWRVVVVEDGVTSSSPEAHAAALDLFRRRFSCQIEIAPAADVLAVWQSQA